MLSFSNDFVLMLTSAYKSNCILVKNIGVPILLFCLVCCLSAKAQVNYSSYDLLAIKQNRAVLKTAEKNWNRSKLYDLGIFYEKIYAKYKDTCMRAAIRCYTLVTASEGPDYLNKVSPKAAYRLAQIYELGNGVTKDIKKPMIYYFLSGEKGKSNLKKLQQANCANAQVAHNSVGKYQLIDSLVLNVSPFCKIKGDAYSAAMIIVTDFLKFNPSFRISITVADDARTLPAPYRYWLRDVGLLRHYNNVKHFIVDEQGISDERLVAPEIDLDSEGPTRVTIKILRDLNQF